MTLNFDAPLDQKTDVEIAEQLAYYRLERQKVRYRKDQEAQQIRHMCHEWEGKLKAERSRRKREGVECPGCGGLGSLGCDPDTRETIWCEGCEYGLTLHKGEVRRKADDANAWLSVGHRMVYPTIANRVSENLDALTAEYDRLTALLELLRAR